MDYNNKEILLEKNIVKNSRKNFIEYYAGKILVKKF